MCILWCILAADVRRYGHLDNFSAFIFENKLKSLKKLVHKSQFPLVQLDRRIRKENKNIVRTGNKSIVSSLHVSLTTMDHVHSRQTVNNSSKQNPRLTSFLLSIADSVFMTETNTPARVRNIVKYEWCYSIVL